jgi:hypothetical protein
MAGMDAQAGAADFEAAGQSGNRFWPLLRQSFTAHGLLLAIAFIYVAAYAALSLTVPGMGTKPGGEILFGIASFSVPAVLFGLLSYLFFDMAIHDKPDRPIKALGAKMMTVLRDRERMANGIPAAVALIIFMYVFTMLKAYVPVINPYSWDTTFDRWDQALHFGYRPWELLQPVFGWWPVTFLVNLNYNMWFVVMNVFWAYHAFIVKPGARRTRFFLGYCLIWMIGGGLLAITFSSAGPCYFTRLGIAPDPYLPLMDYLKSANAHAPIWALGTQDMLWDLHQEGSAFGGVSAMPSMHNATALLFVLASRGWARWIRLTLIGHCVLILLGSVHLGWHYAVDGYLAWALALALWWFAGVLARWWETTPAAQDYQLALQTGG